MDRSRRDAQLQLVRDALNSCIASCAAAKAMCAAKSEGAVLAAMDVAGAHLKAARARVASMIFDTGWGEGQESLPGVD